jgi:hypothetical protein
VVSELFSGGTAVHILIAEINKVLLAEATLGLNARCDRFGKRNGNASFVTREDFLTAVVAPIGNCLQVVGAEDRLRLASDVGELRSICAVVRYLMRDDQMMFRIDRDA